MLNSGTQNLDQILSMGQFMNNQNDLGYIGVTSDVVMTSKTVLVKATVTTPNHHIFGKTFKPAQPKVKMFVPICYFCKMPSHIHPKCYTSIKFLRMKRNENLFMHQEKLLRSRLNWIINH